MPRRNPPSPRAARNSRENTLQKLLIFPLITRARRVLIRSVLRPLPWQLGARAPLPSVAAVHFRVLCSRRCRVRSRRNAGPGRDVTHPPCVSCNAGSHRCADIPTVRMKRPARTQRPTLPCLRRDSTPSPSGRRDLLQNKELIAVGVALTAQCPTASRSICRTPARRRHRAGTRRGRDGRRHAASGGTPSHLRTSWLDRADNARGHSPRTLVDHCRLTTRLSTRGAGGSRGVEFREDAAAAARALPAQRSIARRLPHPCREPGLIDPPRFSRMSRCAHHRSSTFPAAADGASPANATLMYFSEAGNSRTSPERLLHARTAVPLHRRRTPAASSPRAPSGRPACVPISRFPPRHRAMYARRPRPRLWRSADCPRQQPHRGPAFAWASPPAAAARFCRCLSLLCRRRRSERDRPRTERARLFIDPVTLANVQRIASCPSRLELNSPAWSRRRLAKVNLTTLLYVSPCR